MIYTIVKSTSNIFSGITFEANSLTVQKIEDAIHKFGTNILIKKNDEGLYYCSNEHLTLIIKEEA